MNTSTSRVAKGLPTGGQFAATAHPESSLSLTRRREALEDWPKSMPEPEVSITVDEEGALITTVRDPDTGSEIQAWHAGNGSDRIDGDGTGDWNGIDEDSLEAATQWAEDRHSEISIRYKAAQQSMMIRERESILGGINGAPKPVNDTELNQLIGANRKAKDSASRDFELATTALISRNILKEHPTATHIGLQVDHDYSYGETISGALVYDQHGSELAQYAASDAYRDDLYDFEGQGIVEHLPTLEADPVRSHWHTYNCRNNEDDNDMYTIRLHEAAAWAPGGQK